jgi:hypothetical protein
MHSLSLRRIPLSLSFSLSWIPLRLLTYLKRTASIFVGERPLLIMSEARGLCAMTLDTVQRFHKTFQKKKRRRKANWTLSTDRMKYTNFYWISNWNLCNAEITFLFCVLSWTTLKCD